MKRLNKDFVIQLQEMIIDKSGGSKGLRDEGLLESAIGGAFQTFGGNELYPDDLDKIINISYSLIKNHSFIDGNKRIGVLILVILLKENNYILKWSDKDLIKIGLDVASGKMDKEDFRKFIEKKINNR